MYNRKITTRGAAFLILLPVVVIGFISLFIADDDVVDDNSIKKIETYSAFYPNTFPIAEDRGLCGVASYYDYTLKSGWSSVGHLVCATRDFPRGTMIEATSVANGKSVVCKVTDYGPDYSLFPERIIDLSSTAFSSISNTKLGVTSVCIKKYEPI